MLHGDGGGKAPALGHSVAGAPTSARTMIAWAGWACASADRIRPTTVNGGPGALVHDAEGQSSAVWALEIAMARVAGVASIVNPDKLRHLGDVGNLTDTLRAARDRA